MMGNDIVFRKEKKTSFLFLLPSFVGLLTFYAVPAVFSLKYAMTDSTIDGSFVGLQNFQNLFASDPFRLAIKNTLLFMASSIPLAIIIPLFIGCLLNSVMKNRILGVIFMSPLVIPSACIAFLFQSFFASNGLVSHILGENINWLQTDKAFMIAVSMYIWRNMGYNLVLIMAGLANIPNEYYELASVEGMGKTRQFFEITTTYLIPSLFIVLVMSFINSFKVFREIYMLCGNYPNENIYMLQHYMNNQFASLNYQNLTTASIIITAVITICVIIFFVIDKKSAFGE